MTKKIIKPWGHEEVIEINKKYMFKKLYMKKGHRCSLQFHQKKKETVFVLSGKLKLILKKNNRTQFKIMTRGQSISIPPKTIHRMQAISNCYYLEASSPEISDVVRIQDDYKR